MDTYPRECRLALDLIERLGRPLDDLMVQQNELLQIAAFKFAQSYQGDSPFVVRIHRVVNAKPYRMPHGARLFVLQIMARELAAVGVGA